MTVRGIHTGDTHIDSDVHGTLNPATGMNRAWESHARALQSVVRRAVEEKVDFFVHAGDAFKNGRPSQEAVLLFADTLAPLTAANIPIVLIDGNHERLLVPTAQRTATATVGSILSSRGEVHVVDRHPQLVHLDNGIQVACLPWLSKTTILSQLGEEQADPADGDRKVVQFSLDSLERMCGEARTDTPLVLASHVTVDDVRLDNLANGHRRGSELDITHIFAEPILPRKALQDSPVSYAALSHIHARQRIGSKCFYAGCPDRLTMTDADDDKSANLVTIGDDNTLESVEHIPTDARGMSRIDLNADDAEARLDRLEPGALVGLVLAPGDPIPPESVRQQIVEAGASIVSSKTTPKARDKTGSTRLPEKTDPLAALRSWFESHQQPENIDSEYAVSLASGLTEEAA